MDATPQEFDRVLSSMCTRPHPAAARAAQRFLADNPGDPATYPDVAALEERALDTLGTVAGLDDPAGYVAGGGTEANLQAVRAARDLAASDEPVVVAPTSVHFSFQKAADVLGVTLRLVPTDDDHRADPDAVAAAVGDETALVVAVAGTTEFGRVDPIPELAAIAAEADARFHVDAAWGGFHLPFTEHEWHFGHASLDTLTIDPHKVGRAPIPAGGFLARDRATLDALAVETPYLETTAQATLAGTRSGAGVAGAAAALDAQWPDEYRENHERAAANATYLAEGLRDRGYDVVPPGLPLVAFDLPESAFDAVRAEGWRLSRTGSGEARIVCMPHVTRAMLEAFLETLDAVRVGASGR
ncbi:tyrosine decarboxylase MfnA [Halarchaeum nitratireducens]|uniref:Tyrosine decarboxylase MfnA n=1 Tax=Halarchaeum nitratireducens TaxID=489913 RepID=A0A830GC53_9EURY|nr:MULTISPECIES: tyrosine decarboxylase MfnA [Halarchaeum]MBP2252280.1 tyrosine decarboxylase/aspartate 1-decarboxylase [Halarchaeum solikamskense]GGN17643.1 tyrosine decarboxylase MfnA [Halarchaeum nitratireducens]